MIAVAEYAETSLDQTSASRAEIYSDLTRLVERLHRRLLDVLSIELQRLGIEDINAVQALLLTDVDEEISVRDLRRRAYHLGSSISYNLKKLIECGYLEQERSSHDRRSVRVRATEAGKKICQTVRELEQNQAERMFDNEAAVADLRSSCEFLRRLEQTWSDFIQAGQLRSL